MSKISKKSRLIAATAFVLGITAFGASVSYANTTATRKGDSMHDLIEAIATKFDLNSDEVETVVKEVLERQHKDREARFEEKFDLYLAQALTDGKLTQTQVDLITAKKDEMKASVEEFKDMTDDERHEAIRKHMEDTKEWATENDIPEEFMRFGKHSGPKGPRLAEVPEE